MGPPLPWPDTEQSAHTIRHYSCTDRTTEHNEVCRWQVKVELERRCSTTFQVTASPVETAAGGTAVGAPVDYTVRHSVLHYPVLNSGLRRAVNALWAEASRVRSVRGNLQQEGEHQLTNHQTFLQ